MRVAHQWPIVAVAATVKAEGGTIAEARVGLTNMGSTPLRARAVEAGPGRQPATDEAVRAAAAAGRRGHQPALGPQRRRRLPQAPRHRADPARRARGGGSVTPVELTHRFTVPAARRRDLGALQGHRVGRGAASRAPRSLGRGRRRSRARCKVKLGPIALVYNGAGTFVEKDEAAHRFVVDAKGKDKRGNGTAGATVTADHRRGGRRLHRRRRCITDLAITGKPAQFGRGRHAGRLRQAARAVRRLPRAAAGPAGAPSAGAPPAAGPPPAAAAPAAAAAAGGRRDRRRRAGRAAGRAGRRAAAAPAPRRTAPPLRRSPRPRHAHRGRRAGPRRDRAAGPGEDLLEAGAAALVVVGVIVWLRHVLAGSLRLGHADAVDPGRQLRLEAERPRSAPTTSEPTTSEPM